MPIIINLDVMMARRKIGLMELSEKIGISPANLSILKNNKAKAVRFSTLEALCRALDCQPADAAVGSIWRQCGLVEQFHMADSLFFDILVIAGGLFAVCIGRTAHWPHRRLGRYFGIGRQAGIVGTFAVPLWNRSVRRESGHGAQGFIGGGHCIAVHVGAGGIAGYGRPGICPVAH